MVFFYNLVPKDSTSSPTILWSWCGGYWPTSGIKIVHFHSEKKIMKLNQDKNSQKNMLLQQKKLEKYEGVIWKLFCFFVTVTLFYSSLLNSERLGVLSEIGLNWIRLPKVVVTELIECKSNFQNFTLQVLSIGAKTLPIIFSSLLGHGEACWKCFLVDIFEIELLDQKLFNFLWRKISIFKFISLFSFSQATI